MKRRIASPIISFLICLLLLPLATIGTVSVASSDHVLPSTPNGGWGSSETFDKVPTGTTHPFNDFSLWPNPSTDTVVLDGRLWIMFRGNDSALVAKYSPSVAQKNWNMSFDAFTPRNGAAYRAVNQLGGTYGLRIMLVGGGGRNLTGIELLIGPQGVEGIYSFDPVSGVWTRGSAGILPAVTNRSTDQESSPDHYTVSMARTPSNSILLTVTHSRAGVILVKEVAIDIGSEMAPSLLLYSDAAVAHVATSDVHGPYPASGGWMLDNFQTRPNGVTLAEVEPKIEVNQRSAPQWVTVVDPFGNIVSDASVTIGGRPAIFNPVNGRYEAVSSNPLVDWTVPTTYRVITGEVVIEGQIKVTTTPDPCAAFVTKWWNGWAWATVLGRDDCYGPQTVLDTYRGYDHPLTAYVFTDSVLGNSQMILPTQSEIGKHGPHDYYNWMKKTWQESVASANQGQQALEKAYTFASRWDDPSYVGNGDTYISLANPGNTATFQMEYAQYLAGIRIEGTSSKQGNGAAGNDSLIGSWGTDPWSRWDPMDPIDLMDAVRQLNTDGSIAYADLIAIARQGGLARIYNHGVIHQPDVLRWICNDKSDVTLQNWKATDGEAASYYYVRMTTDVRAVTNAADPNVKIFEVSCLDPKASGYWLVPITIAIPVGNVSIQSIEVIGKDSTLSSNDPSGLRNLSGARVMDIGYDLRGGVLYVSAFWNSSSELRIHLTPLDPSIVNRPLVSTPVGSTYTYDAVPTQGTSAVVWTLTADAPFLSIQSSDRTHCLVAGTPTVVGHYSVSLTVSSPFHSDSVNYTLNVWQPPDTDPPVTVISGDVQGWVNHSARFELAATDGASGVKETRFSIDGGPWTVYTRSVSIDEDGHHIVRYYSTDYAGNEERVNQTEILVDRNLPEIRFDTKEHQQFFGGKVVLHFSSWDNMSGIGSITIIDESGRSYRIAPGDTTLVLDTVETGNWTYVMEVRDNAGNIAVTDPIIDVRSGGVLAWNDSFLVNVLALSAAAGVLSATAIVLGRRTKGSV